MIHRETSPDAISQRPHVAQPTLGERLLNGVYTKLILPRLESPLGIFILALMGIGIALLGVKMGSVILILFITASIGFPIVFSTLFFQQVGIYLLLFFAFFLGTLLMALPSIQIGLIQDVLILFMFSGLLIRTYRNGEWRTFKTPLNLPIVLWIGYNLAQIANPQAASREAWFYVMRPAVGYVLFFFIVYHALSNKASVVTLLNVVLGFGVLSAMWGIVQYYAGYFDFEMTYIVSHEAVHLVFNDGRWRSFGTMASPSQYGILMACFLVVSGVLAVTAQKRMMQFLYATAAVLFLFALLYSGTRSAFVILPLSFMMMTILARSVKMLVTAAIFGLFLFGLIQMPTNNYQLLRLQSAFNGSNDPSYLVRKKNREMIMPWIASHPIGGGLGSTGVWGQRFSPNTFLANFPPDSGLIRVAVELGWIGLLFYLFLWGNILVRGVTSYWKLQEQPLKPISMALLSILFSILVVEYAQDIVGKMPSSLLFWVFLALLFRSTSLNEAT
ncbi:MAG: O-antigen ligase family protein [Chloroherpetonaceae bacterium]|nr:O-antigen ligase family protein [Chloroherpetonaceae bacterium]